MPETPDRLMFTLEPDMQTSLPQPPSLIVAFVLLIALLMGWVLGYIMGSEDAAPEAPVAEEPVGASRVSVEVLYNKRPEVSIVTVDGVQYLSVNYLIGGAGVTPLVVPALPVED